MSSNNNTIPDFESEQAATGQLFTTLADEHPTPFGSLSIDEIVFIFAAHPDANTTAAGPGIVNENRGIAMFYAPPEAFEFDSDIGESDYTLFKNGVNLYRSHDLAVGVGIFMTTAEVSGFSLSEAREAFVNRLSSGALGAFDKWQEQLTPRDRQLRLLDLAEGRRENPLVDKHLDEGQFFDIEPATGATDRYIKNIVSNTPGVEDNPQQCYENCLTAYAEFHNPDRIVYCEGIMLPRHAVRPLVHAWLVVDGTVAELSLPWHSPYPTVAAYFGVRVEENVVSDTLKIGASEGRYPVPASVDEKVRERLRNDPAA